MTNTNTLQKIWRVRILGTTWLSYAGFYFCRKNYAIVKSSLQEQLMINNSELAHIFTVYLFAYMLGQFMTGILGRKTTTRILLLGGMLVTLIVNILMGFGTLAGPAGYYPFMVLMMINGFAQSTGWPGNVGVLSNWLNSHERGRVMALWATCYQIGSILAKIFAAFMLSLLGVAWSFWGAALIMFAIWIVFYFYQRDDPEDVGLPPIVEEVPLSKDDTNFDKSSHKWTRSVLLSIICMGIVYFVFKFLRYALDSWTPMAIETVFKMPADEAGYISTIFDWVGFTGVLIGGWATDKFFDGKRHQVILIMSIGMFIAFFLLTTIGTQSLVLFSIFLALSGFMLMGPDSLLSGVGAIDVGGSKSGALMAAGIINGLGSIGPVIQEEVIGWVLDNYDFQTSFHLLAVVAFFSIIGAMYLSYRSRKGLSNL